MLESIQIRNLVFYLTRTLAQRNKLAFADPSADIPCTIVLECLVLGNDAAWPAAGLVHLHDDLPCEILDEHVIGDHLVRKFQL